MKRPENLLLQSRIEIARIMQMLARENCRITAELKSGNLFSSSIIAFDPATERFAVAYSPHKLINAMLLDSPKVEFTATDRQEMHFSFEATAPEEANIDGQPAIQFSLPRALYLHNRREYARIPVSAEISLRCVADESGVIPFESHITDVSHDGMGCLVYDPEVNLEKGTILKDCRIITHKGEAVVADLEVRHISTATLANGSPVRRAGFRFVNKTADQDKLIGIFIQDLDKK
jgi:flagellar brake protein